MIAYKIVEYDKGVLKSLFHGTNGTRIMEQHTWLEAQIRENAKDGTSKTTYKSGWHVLPTLDECKAYLSRFTKRLDKLVIVEVEIGGDIWEKEHSPSNVLLSTRMKINDVVYKHLDGNTALEDASKVFDKGELEAAITRMKNYQERLDGNRMKGKVEEETGGALAGKIK